MTWTILNSLGQVKTAIGGDHGALIGLTDDDHTQYALLLGRSGGQTVLGGTGSGDDLILNSTSNATKGDVEIQQAGGNVIIGGGATAANLRLLEASGSGTNYTEFRTQPQSANITYILPADDGDASQVLSTDGSGTLDWVASSAGGFTLGTKQASTSGTAITFTGIPAGTKMIVITFSAVSTNGTSPLGVQLGDSDGIETTGYLGASVALGNASIGSRITNTSMFLLTSAMVAANSYSGECTLTLEDSADFTWVQASLGDRTDGNMFPGAGIKSLSAELTQLRITTSTTDTFDAGEINILYS